MIDLEHMPIADSQNNGEGLAPLSAPSRQKTGNSNPESFLQLSAPIIIASWPKNSREKLQVKLDAFKGQVVVDCRVWYEDKDGELKPGRGGLTVSIKHLPALARAITLALDKAKAAGLILEGGEI